MNEREEFEKVFGVPENDRLGNGYRDRDNQTLWVGWQARAAWGLRLGENKLEN